MDDSNRNPTPATDDRRAGRRLRIALFVSLALNIAVAGMVVGAIFRHGGDWSRPPTADFSYRPLTDAFSDSDRAALRQSFSARSDQVRAWRAERAAQNEALLAMLRAEPLDIGAIEARFAEERTRAAERAAFGQTLILDRIAAMTAEERAAFADRLEHEMHHRDRRSGPPGER